VGDREVPRLIGHHPFGPRPDLREVLGGSDQDPRAGPPALVGVHQRATQTRSRCWTRLLVMAIWCWIDLFTLETWDGLPRPGVGASGFREGRRVGEARVWPSVTPGFRGPSGEESASPMAVS
jgi:hypothetical protein